MQEDLAGLLRDELLDPALAGVAVTSVEPSADYRTARVRDTLAGAAPGAAHVRAAQRALERATPLLRARLLDALELKRVPALRFVPDRAAPPPVTTALGPGDDEEGPCRA